jgi:hypothetical protein
MAELEVLSQSYLERLRNTTGNLSQESRWRGITAEMRTWHIWNKIRSSSNLLCSQHIHILQPKFWEHAIAYFPFITI